MKRRIAAFLTFIMVLSTCMTAMAASYSVKWSQATDGNWRVTKNGVLLKNTWILDDQCDVAGGLYYLVDENGNMVSNQLIKDGEGRYYTFNDQHDGHFGAMRTANGKYQGINLTFSAVHDGSFGSITNADGIKALAAKYGVREMPNIKNASTVKMSEINSASSSGGSGSGGSGGYIPYVVSFDVNFNNATPSEYAVQNIVSGNKVVKPASPSDLGREMRFTGWTRTRDGIDYWDFEKDTVSTAVTLYAKWTEITENYLTFIAEEDNSSITFNYAQGTMQYCRLVDNWIDCPSGTKVTLSNAGDVIQLRGWGIKTTVTTQKAPGKGFRMTGKISASGSVTSLTDGDGSDPNVQLTEGCYAGMFSGCSKLTAAPELPALKLAEKCYYSMFNSCKGLTEAPELPATELANGCYEGMFDSCTALDEAPELEATTLSDYCYADMFTGCIALTKAPELPAMELAKGCYGSMFEDCTALTKAPKLPATTMKKSCYHCMFMGSGLTEAPALPATTLADACYMQMFQSCKELTKASELKATELSIQCYDKMFFGCSKLIVVENDITGQKIFTCPGTIPEAAVFEMFKSINGGTVTVRGGKTYSYSTQQPPQ